MDKNLSFRGDATLKTLHVAQAVRHAAADMLLAGTYGEGTGSEFRGCSVACFAYDIDPNADADDNLHQIVAEARGLPLWLIQMQEAIFEGLPQGDRPGFHVELARRIPVGVDLDPAQYWIAIERIDHLLASQQVALRAQHPNLVHKAIQKTIEALHLARRAYEGAAGGNSCDLPAAREAARAAAELAATSVISMSSVRLGVAASSAARSVWAAARSVWATLGSATAAEPAAWQAERAARTAAWQAERDALFAALDRAGTTSGQV